MTTWATSTHSIPRGRAGTVITLRAMQKLAVQGAGHPTVIEAAQDVVRSVPERNDTATMGAIMQDVRRRMRYTADPLGTELVKAPEVVIHRTATGQKEPMDCDDASVLLSSMLGAVGIRSRFAAVAANRANPREFSHVYVEALDSQQNRWVSLDPIVRRFGVGDAVPEQNVFRRMRNPGGLGMIEPTRNTGLGCANCPNMGGAGLGADPSSGGFVNEWLNPFYDDGKGPDLGPIKNIKAAAVVGVLGFVLWKKLK